MQRKTFDFDIKSAGDEGTFEALVSVFGNVDRVGDRVIKGAFRESLNQWREKGHPIPVIFSHKWDDPNAHIGYAHPNDVKETPEGLMVKGTLDIDENPLAKQVHRLMKRGSLRAFSFGYHVKKDRVAEDGVTELLDLDLHEVGPTLVGANQDAELRAVKSALEQVTTTSAGLESAEDDAQKGEEPPAKPITASLRRRVLRARIQARL